MSTLKQFLEEAFNSLKQWRDFQNIHIVLGNESCDLDSTMCSLAYGYYLSKKLNIRNCVDTVVFPVVNVPSEEFPIRTEHCSLLKDINIYLSKIIYRSEIKIDDILLEKKDGVKTYLVDHHVLNKNDELLKDTVHKIFDHRPVDKNSKWSSEIELRIEPVGSCATLIADEMLKRKECYSRNWHICYIPIFEKSDTKFENLKIKEENIDHFAVSGTIVFDTLAVLPENKKATALDIETAKKLEEKFGFKEPKLNLFQKIVNLHADVSDLTPAQLLVRDLKFVDNVPIPGLPMLAETFSKLPGAEQGLKHMAVKHGAPFILLVGIEANPDVKRDVAIFMVKDDAKLKNLLLDEVKSHVDFRFEESSCQVQNLTVFRQTNIEKSRKQIIPIVRNFIDTKMDQGIGNSVMGN